MFIPSLGNCDIGPIKLVRCILYKGSVIYSAFAVVGKMLGCSVSEYAMV